MSEKSRRIPGRTFFRSLKDDTFYAYSSLDEIVLTTDNTTDSDHLVYVDLEKHNVIYADVVRFDSNFTLNSRKTFTIFAREIKCSSSGITLLSSNGRPGDKISNRPLKSAAPLPQKDGRNKNGHSYDCAENTQDGDNGNNADAPVKDGVAGENGGEITIYAHKLSLPDIKSKFQIEAKGGDGQRGQDGQDGGKGGNAYYRLYDRFLGSNIYQSGYGGLGGNASDGGAGGNGGDGGKISVLFDTISTGELIVNSDGGLGNSKGAPGKPGEGGTHKNNRDDRVDADLKFRSSVNPYGQDDFSWRKWERRKENHGRDDHEIGTTKAPNGILITNNKTDGKKGSKGTEKKLNPNTIVSATHLQMLLERAKSTHLILSLQVVPGNTDREEVIKKFSKVAELLDWIIERSKWVQNDVSVKEVDRDPLDIEALRDVCLEAIRLQNYAAFGIGPFGGDLLNPMVPNLSYDFLDSVLNEEIKHLIDIKKDYDAILNAEDVYKNEKNAFDRRYNTYQALKIVAESKKTDCFKDLQDVAANIESLNITLAAVRDRLIQRSDEFQQAISAFGFPTWDELVNAATMIVFATPLAAVEGLDLFRKGMTEVSTDDESKVNKKLILQKTENLNSDIQKNLKIQYDGLVQAIDPGNQGLLISEIAEYDKIVLKFMNYTSARELHKVLQDFFSIVSQRNDLIIQYNQLLFQISEIDEKLSSLLKEQSHDLAKMASITDPVVASLTASLARRYSAALEYTLHQLTMLESAYRYCTLEDCSKAFQQKFSLEFQWGGGKDILNQLSPADISECRDNIVKEYRDFLGNQTNPPTCFPQNENDPGILLKLRPNETGVFDFIYHKDEGYCYTFKIVSSKNEIPENFVGSYYLPELANVHDTRLWANKNNGVNINVYLDREDDSVSTISADLIHGRRDSIYNSSGIKQVFQLRSNVVFPLISRPKKLNLEKTSPTLPFSTYRQLGPYTEWTLWFRTMNGANPGFDPKSIKRIELEFFVMFRGHVTK